MPRSTMSIAELAESLGISRPQAYKVVEQEDFPLIRVGKRKLVPIEGFNQWLRAQTNLNVIKRGGNNDENEDNQ